MTLDAWVRISVHSSPMLKLDCSLCSWTVPLAWSQPHPLPCYPWTHLLEPTYVHMQHTNKQKMTSTHQASSGFDPKIFCFLLGGGGVLHLDIRRFFKIIVHMSYNDKHLHQNGKAKYWHKSDIMNGFKSMASKTCHFIYYKSWKMICTRIFSYRLVSMGVMMNFSCYFTAYYNFM